MARQDEAAGSVRDHRTTALTMSTLAFTVCLPSGRSFPSLVSRSRRSLGRCAPRGVRKRVGGYHGFASAVASFRAFFIPKSFGLSIAMTGGAAFALYVFFAFYLSCIAITWFFYTRWGGLLFDVERGVKPRPAAATSPAR